MQKADNGNQQSGANLIEPFDNMISGTSVKIQQTPAS